MAQSRKSHRLPAGKLRNIRSNCKCPLHSMAPWRKSPRFSAGKLRLALPRDPHAFSVAPDRAMTLARLTAGRGWLLILPLEVGPSASPKQYPPRCPVLPLKYLPQTCPKLIQNGLRPCWDKFGNVWGQFYRPDRPIWRACLGLAEGHN